VLGDDARVAELADVVDRRQPAHHVIPGEPMKRVEMVETLMPTPRTLSLRAARQSGLAALRWRM
jgi:hypothetical protein